jgi:hypothetical protein
VAGRSEDLGLLAVRVDARVLGSRVYRTSHTSGLGGFCGPGGSVVGGSWSLGSREVAGPTLGGESWVSIAVEERG